MTKPLIGIYGGTFDPIHFGHINLALEVLEKRHLDEVWFCPSYMNPLKEDQPLFSALHRLKMVELAIEEIPGFRLLNIEMELHQPSFTVETLRRLTSSEFGLSPDQLTLILGGDSFLHFSEWRDPEEIIRLTSLAIGSRITSEAVPLSMTLQKWGLRTESVIPTRILEISSTEIRDRLAKGLYCGHLLPAKVIDYISRHHLY